MTVTVDFFNDHGDVVDTLDVTRAADKVRAAYGHAYRTGACAFSVVMRGPDGTQCCVAGRRIPDPD